MMSNARQTTTSSRPAPSSGTEVLLEAARRQRSRVLYAASAIRLGGAALLLVISLVLWQLAGDSDWQMQVPTLIAYGTLALITFMAQGRKTMVRFAWVQPLLDVGFAYAVLRTSILLGAASAQPMAGLSVAVLLLPVALAGLAYGTRTVVMVTVAAALSNLSLMEQAGLTLWPAIAATAVLLLAASASKLARETIEAEITRRLLAESHARCEELANLQRDKDSLVGIIVHDMRSPVNTTLLSLEYLQEEMKRHVVARAWGEAIAEAVAGCSNLSEMIAQILDTTKLEARRMTLQIAVLDLGQLLEQARERSLTHARSKSITLDLETGEPLPVSVDPRLLVRTFESLITCAIRQTPTGGRILLQTSRVGDQAQVAVHRSGAPVPAEQREALFEKFPPGTTSGHRLDGWGLGLYFSRLTAQAHGANLTVESTEGWAASYVLRIATLPSVAAATESAQSPVRLGPLTPLGHSTSSSNLPAISPGSATPQEYIRRATPLSLPTSSSSSALLAVRRPSPSPKTRAALDEFARALSPFDAGLARTPLR
jgi:two-component system, OmpR family, heavy metal sensor histidine kinase CusS